MSRRTVVTALAGALLLGAFGAPALADPISDLITTDDKRTTVCLRTDGGEGAREGYCVWVPVGR